MKSTDPLDPDYDGFEVHSAGSSRESPPGSREASSDSDAGTRKDPLTYIRDAAQAIVNDVGLSSERKSSDLEQLGGACDIIARAYTRLGRKSKAEEAAAEAKRYYEVAQAVSEQADSE